MHILDKVINFQQLKSFYPETKAVLWDMDGTIMETEQVHAKAFINLLTENGIENGPQIKDIKDNCIGMTDHQVLDQLQLRGMFSHFDYVTFLERKNSHLMNLVKDLKKENILSSKVLDLILELKNNNIPQAIVTSSERDITTYLLSFLDLSHLFEFVITREDVTQNKPHPMPYLHAIEKMNINSKHITIFEDSHTGLQAAKQSGANVFHVKWYSDPKLANN